MITFQAVNWESASDLLAQMHGETTETDLLDNAVSPRAVNCG
jgi:hypothetical protein